MERRVSPYLNILISTYLCVSARIIFLIFTFTLFSCVSSDSTMNSVKAVQEITQTENNLTLDAAITEAAAYLVQRLSTNAKVAIVHFDASTGRLSDYIFEELWARFEDSGKFVMVDRRNLDRIEAETSYQMRSGRVDDDQIASISKQYGAEILVYGQIVPMGQDAFAPVTAESEYRMTVYATDVERAVSNQRVFNVKQDNRLVSLLGSSLNDEVERALSVMARAVEQRTTLTVGRISYVNTQTVSSLSGWLKNSIVTGMQKHPGKFRLASDSESSDFIDSSLGIKAGTDAGSVQAVIAGTYSPLDSGAEVSLRLVSTGGDRPVLASAWFTVSSSELERRRLSLLPEKENAVVSAAEFEVKQQAIQPYTGKNNSWVFSITPNVLDGIYRDGEYMTMQLYSERDCYFRITHVDVNGNTQVIYPTSSRDNNFIRAGESRRVPDNIRYRLGQPFGEELILAAAYEKPFALNNQSGMLSKELITRSLVAHTENRAELSPLVTTMFTYTILPMDQRGK